METPTITIPPTYTESELLRQGLIDMMLGIKERDDRLKLLSIFLTNEYKLDDVKYVISWLKANSHI
jgi:hypothetical protein